MFDNLTNGFRDATAKLRGKTTLTEQNIEGTLEEIRKSLLEADVEYGVVRGFLDRVKDKALGQEVQLKAGKGAERVRANAGEHFVRICKEELEALMGEGQTEFKLATSRISSVMMVGLQGTGKTTTTGKIAKFLTERRKRKPLLVAADTYRPAAADQLKVLGDRIGVPVFHIENAKPTEIYKLAPKRKNSAATC